jgi:isopropylmalate/homocitrate/citramalate synthase
MYDHFVAPPLPPLPPVPTLLDVTLRDGGFEVDFHWPDELFAALPAALAPVGIDMVELGYLGGVPLEHSVAVAGIGAFLTPHHVQTARRAGPRLAAMVHPTALRTPIDLEPYADAGLDMVRLVYHPNWLREVSELAAAARRIGLAVSVNVALASRYEPHELTEHAVMIAERINPDAVYIADTCSAMVPTQVGDLVSRVRAATDTAVGFHAHDFLNLAYANALAAVDAGAAYIDCSMLGLGRGGGNLSAELMLLRHRLGSGTVHTTDAAALLRCRSQLATRTHRSPASLVPVVCGGLNLTPVEEQSLRNFAAAEHLDVELAAVWLACVAEQADSLRVADLRRLWHDLNRECAG